MNTATQRAHHSGTSPVTTVAGYLLTRLAEASASGQLLLR